MRFVPTVEKRPIQRVVDKQAFMNQVAQILVREQVSRAYRHDASPNTDLHASLK